MSQQSRYPDGRDWSSVKAPIMFKEFNEVIAMDIIHRIDHWPRTGVKGMPQIHKIMQWIVAVYDPKSPLQREYKGDVRAKKEHAAKIVGFEKKDGVWKPDIYDSLLSSSMAPPEEEPDEDDLDKPSERLINEKVMRMIVGYVLWAAGRKWQALCSYENFYTELIYLINKPLSSEKSKDLMEALKKKNEIKNSIRDTDKMIEEAWEEIIQEDKDLVPFLEREKPIRPENQ